MSFLRKLWEKWRRWQSRLLHHSRTQAQWERTKERTGKVLRAYRSLPKEMQESLREIPDNVRRLQEGIYEQLLVQDRILIHLPPNRWWQQTWYNLLVWWHEHRKEFEIADTYRELLKPLQETSRSRYQAWQQAKQIEAQVERWLVELDVLHDNILLLRSQPQTAPATPPSLLEALQVLQQEMENYRQSLEELKGWLGEHQP